MKKMALGLLAGLMVFAVAGEASARSVVVRTVNLRAGPDTDYPVVARIAKNSTIKVHGCIDDWDWCDVSVSRLRGWVRSDFIYTTYRNRNVAFVEAAPRLDVPIISFNIGYWDNYYRSRPFYRDRARWEHRHYDHGWRDDRHDRDDHRDHGRRDNDRGWNDRDRGWDRR